uniref:Polyprotein n=1 Tax=Cajanus cajan TaxID=3821 RepID=A0A151TR28_CAJCA|nr:polyprotein [Cajanus cajan]
MASSTGPDPIYESPDESPRQRPRNGVAKPTSGPWFTLDDVEPSQWRSRLIEFGVWLDTKFMKGDAEPYKIIEEFGCRMTGILKEWYANLGPVRQNTFHDLGNTAAVLGAIHEEFIGDGVLTDRKIRQEFFEMKSCSLKMKDLDKHYLRMVKRFYLLNGLNNPSLKSTYVSSLPAEIQPELARMAVAVNKDFTALTMGRMTQEAVDKLCRQHEYFSNMLRDKGKYARACRKPFLEIKCKDKDRCHCSKKKFKGKKFKSHFKKRKHKKPYRFFRKKETRGRNPGQRCYICGKTGHFAKSCPNKAHKSIKMITLLHLDDRDEVESLYSEQSFADEDTVFALQESFSDDSVFAVDQIDNITTVAPPHPNVEIEILPSKYEKPIKVIGFLDTGAQKTMMNPEILSPHFWKKETTYFIAADGKTFKTEVISQAPVGIRLFPPALKIPGNGKRIIQTDASDHYWGVVFIEEMEGKKFYCGYASGQFKEAEKHYYTTYKEALAVKNGIKKFDFHLRGLHFEVQMDNSSFPKILDFKNKLPPEPQILRLKDWFSRYDFTIKHIKRKHNLIPDFLSRPQKLVFIISSSHSFPLIFMVKPLPNIAKTRKLYPPGLDPKSPEEIIQFAKAHYYYYLHETLRYKIVPPTMFDPTEEHPIIFELLCEIGWDLCEPTLWVIWCKTVQHPIPIALRTQSAYDILINPDKDNYLFWTLLEWFSPLPWWRRELKRILNFQRNQKGKTREQCESLTSIAIISRPYFQKLTGQLWSKNKAYFWGTFETYPPDQSYRTQLINHLKETRIH